MARWITALVAAALGAAALTVPPPVQAATPAGPIAASPKFTTVAGKTVPCPRAKPPAGLNLPRRPKPPPADPVARAVGGTALATDGLVIPDGAPKPPTLSATSWLVADLDTGEVLGGCGPHVHATPASVQKLLLAAAVLPLLDPDRKVTVTRKDLDFEPGSSAVGLLAGGRYTVRTLWLGLLLNSGNDAANVLARLGGGTGDIAGGVALMNAEARRLGALQTKAVTPSGLDGPGQFTSAYDLALIARVLFDRKDFRTYALTRNAQIPAQPPKTRRGFQIQNDNDLVLQYPGALGGKTGFTDLARHTYVGAAKRDGRRLVATLLGAEARPLRGWQQAAALLDWGFSLPRDTAVGRLVEPGELEQPATAETTADDAPRAGDAAPLTAAGPRRADTLTLPPAVTGAAAAVTLTAAPVALLMLVARRNRMRDRRRRVRAVQRG